MQVGLENAVLDHDRAPGLVAFIVIVQRTSFARNTRLVDNGDKGLGDLLADHVRIDADTFTIEVCLHAVADCLVQEDAASTCGQDYGHLARRRAPCIKQDHGAIDGFLDHLCQSLLGVPAKLFTCGDVRVSRLHFITLLCRHENGGAGHWAVIRYQVAF